LKVPGSDLLSPAEKKKRRISFRKGLHMEGTTGFDRAELPYESAKKAKKSPAAKKGSAKKAAPAAKKSAKKSPAAAKKKSPAAKNVKVKLEATR